MNSFLRRTVPAAFLAGGILLGGAGAAGAQLPVDLLGTGGAQGSALLDRTVSMLTAAGGDAASAGAGLDGGGVAGLGGGVVPLAEDTVNQVSDTASGATEAVEDASAVTGQVEQVAAQSGVAEVRTQAAAQACPGGACPEAPAPPAPPAPPECPGCEPPVDCCEPTTTVTTAPPVETTVTTAAHPTTTPEHIVQQELPRTGSTVAPWVAAGAGLLLVGGALLGFARKGALHRA
jgi:LPXTG-motif cell wall-anchored protein